MRGDDHWLSGVTKGLRQILQRNQSFFDAFQTLRQRRWIEVCANRKTFAIIADHQGLVRRFVQPFQRFPARFNQCGGDAVLLGMKFPQQRAIAHIADAAGLIAPKRFQVSRGDFARILDQRPIIAVLRAVTADSSAVFISLIKGRFAAGQHLLNPVGHWIAVGLKAVNRVSDADSIPDFKGAHLMSEAPFVRVVDADNRIGDFRHPMRGISQQEAMQMIQIAAGAVVGIDKQTYPFAKRLDLAILPDAFKTRLCRRLIF